VSAPFVIEEYVRWSDVDAAGVICYGAYVRFIEIAETELFRAAGFPYGRIFERFDCWLPRVRYLSEFHKPALLDQRLKVSASIKRLGRSSMTFAFGFDDESGARIADCEIVMVCVDRKDFAPRPIPDELRIALAPFVI
jgi:YbgC/YbaW family acyl-CoA thioester hydrolase